MSKKNKIITGILILVGILLLAFMLYNNRLANETENDQDIITNKTETPIGLQRYRERKGIESPEEKKEADMKKIEKELEEELLQKEQDMRDDLEPEMLEVEATN